MFRQAFDLVSQVLVEHTSDQSRYEKLQNDCRQMVGSRRDINPYRHAIMGELERAFDGVPESVVTGLVDTYYEQEQGFLFRK